MSSAAAVSGASQLGAAVASRRAGSVFQLGLRLPGLGDEWSLDSLPALECEKCENLWLEIVTEGVLKVWASLKRIRVGEDPKSVEKQTSFDRFKSYLICV